VNNSNLPPILHRFRDMTGLTHSLGWSPKICDGNIWPPKTETFPYHTVYVGLRNVTETDKRTDRQTDRQTDRLAHTDTLAHSICHASLCCTAKNSTEYLRINYGIKSTEKKFNNLLREAMTQWWTFYRLQ